MKKSLISNFMLAFLSIYTYGCGGSDSVKNTTTTDTTTLAADTTKQSPVETKDPNTNYKPAFAGQTRVSGVKTKTAFK
ncbi:MAG: PQQ-dependent sugar dehydrogenase, partial [Chitinophagaceae bacterium]